MSTVAPVIDDYGSRGGGTEGEKVNGLNGSVLAAKVTQPFKSRDWFPSHLLFIHTALSGQEQLGFTYHSDPRSMNPYRVRMKYVDSDLDGIHLKASSSQVPSVLRYRIKPCEMSQQGTTTNLSHGNHGHCNPSVLPSFHAFANANTNKPGLHSATHLTPFTLSYFLTVFPSFVFSPSRHLPLPYTISGVERPKDSPLDNTFMCPAKAIRIRILKVDHASELPKSAGGADSPYYHRNCTNP
ncbi:hypothetical protein SODALDRAFT_354378 [Sodiomyces alkalinus F11]|uniref:Uncharacterized protein n=1 Tax=Sodiomyces alkalinus (strain CBS 110278 / VKM F-3762 / F11) TaxID=1314773 RepID=A0A3N2Q673_SODAK|nr:hypothetical protein SODALDRAFT_354378 [Sodiomyces alkalinus F11]ROT42252.1 hypothetical protein SODALDRAFT_354378 [Sodiomyces alkalinus F11]